MRKIKGDVAAQLRKAASWKTDTLYTSVSMGWSMFMCVLQGCSPHACWVRRSRCLRFGRVRVTSSLTSGPCILHLPKNPNQFFVWQRKRLGTGRMEKGKARIGKLSQLLILCRRREPQRRATRKWANRAIIHLHTPQKRPCVCITCFPEIQQRPQKIV